MQVHGTNPVIVGSVVALLAREAVPARIAIASGHMPALGTGLRGIVGIHRHRAGLRQSSPILDHLPEMGKRP